MSSWAEHGGHENDLWTSFTARLSQTGVELQDIADCTPAVLQSVLAELGFSGIQSAKLQTEWNRRRGGPPASGALPAFGQGSNSRAPSAALGCVRVPVAEGSAEFVEVATQAIDFLQRGSFMPSILGVEAVSNPVRERMCRDFRASLRGDTSSTLRGRLVPIEQVDRSCSEGPIAHGVVDKPFPSALIFHTEVDDHSVGMLVLGSASPTKLILFDFVPGNSKVISEDDATALSVYPGEQVRRSLAQEHYDSIKIQHKHGYRPDLFAVFDQRHAYARYVVTFTYTGSASGASPSSLSPSRGRHAGANSFLPEGIAPLRGGGAPTTCTRHPQKTYDFWCIDEQKLVCSHCMFLDGYQHKQCVLIDDGAKQERPWLEAWVQHADAFSSDASRVMQLFDTALDSIDETTNATLTDLQSSISNLKADLDDIYSRCDKEIRERGKTQAIALQKSLTQVVALQAAVEDVTRAAKQSLASGHPCDILAAREAAGAHWPEVEVPDYKTQRVHFDTTAAAAALIDMMSIVDVDGTVELPLVIDVNQLASGVDSGSRKPTSRR